MTAHGLLGVYAIGLDIGSTPTVCGFFAADSILTRPMLFEWYTVLIALFYDPD